MTPHRLPAISRRRALGVATASLAGQALPSWAQAAYPDRAVRFIVPFPPAGPVDVVGRSVSQKLGELWAVPTLVDNRPGAGGIVGADAAAKSPADGYTLFVCSIHHAVLPALKSPLPYDIQKDFMPISFGATFPIVLVAHPSVPARNVAELIALDRRQPNTLSFGSSGNGGGTHLAGALFNLKAAPRCNMCRTRAARRRCRTCWAGRSS